MGNILIILIFCLMLFFGSNAVFYILNVTDFLYGKEFQITSDLFLNYVYLILIGLFILGILLLINNRLFKKFKYPYHYFVLSLLYCLIFFFINNIIIKNSKLGEINNILSNVLTIFFTTYTFYYSIYYASLLEYKRNN